MNNEINLDDLIARHLDGYLNEAETQLLCDLLEHHDAARKRFVTLTRCELLLDEELAEKSAESRAVDFPRIHPSRSLRRTRLRLLALAATIMISLFSLLGGWISFNTHSSLSPDDTTHPLATIVAIEGSVIINRGTNHLLGEIGFNLQSGDNLRVEQSAVILFQDGTQFELNGGSDLILQPTIISHEKTTGKFVHLKSGFLHAVVAPQPRGKPLIIVTPHSETVVVGTEFELTVGPSSTHLLVSSGKVRFLNQISGISTDVASGNRAESETERPRLSIPDPSPLNPPIAHPALWLRADTGVTLEQGAVARWNDQSGNHFSAFQSDSSKRPHLVVEPSAGQNVLRFDRDNDFLELSLPVNGLAQVTLVILSANPQPSPSTLSDPRMLTALAWPAQDGGNLGGMWLSPLHERLAFSFVSDRQPGNEKNISPWYECLPPHGRLYSLDVAVHGIYRDQLWRGSQLLNGRGGSRMAINGCSDTARIGGSGLNFLVAEILVYPRALDLTELATLRADFRKRYLFTE